MPLALAAELRVRVQALLDPGRSPAGGADDEDDFPVEQAGQAFVVFKVFLHGWAAFSRTRACAATRQSI